jgi:DNA polymerase III subunit alpha
VEELTALNALYRPGPMDMIDDFIERKWGGARWSIMLPELEGILKDSLGVIVYQEQVMQISNVLASYSWARRICCGARWARRMPKAMAEQRDRFLSGAAALGHPKAPVAEIFDPRAGSFARRSICG